MRAREIIPFKQALDLTLKLPGSKSITQRALFCSALAQGKSTLIDVLQAEDTHVMRAALEKMGARFRQKKEGVMVSGFRPSTSGHSLRLNLKDSGTALRFLIALACLREGKTTLFGTPGLHQRPVGDLVDALRQAGAKIEYLKKKGYAPLKIHVGFLESNNDAPLIFHLKASQSSQYLSALLLIAPLLGRPTHIKLEGELASKPYLEMTIAVMKYFGVSVKVRQNAFEIQPQSYQPTTYQIEGDASSATYFRALQFLHGGQVHFENLDEKKSIQGDATFIDVLQKLKKGTQRTINMSSMPDAAPTLAICALFAKGQTTITGLSTLKIKESDRLKALETELRKLGAKVKAAQDSFHLHSLPIRLQYDPNSFPIRTHHDHRLAMSFAVLGSKISALSILEPDCVNKTYPDFWRDLRHAYLAPIQLGQKHLLLTGMRGVGKTYWGKKIAKSLGRPFFDLDEEIEKEEGMRIAEIVKKSGWPAFRKIEQKMCSLFTTKFQENQFKPCVLATGGGVVLHPKSMKELQKNAVNLFLYASPEELYASLKKDKSHRPALTQKSLKKEIQQLWESRRSLYLNYADVAWDIHKIKLRQLDLRKIFKK